jgi:hypothetical protein
MNWLLIVLRTKDSMLPTFNINRNRFIQWLDSLTYDRSTKGRYKGYKWVLDCQRTAIVDGKGKDLLTYQFTMTDVNGRTEKHALMYERWYVERCNFDALYLATIIIEHVIRNNG